MSEENITLYEDGNLQSKKEWRCIEVDERTKELILDGFSFDGETFSLSEQAQTNWLGLKTLQSLLTWPVSVSTKDEGEYDLAEEDLNNFVSLGAQVKQSHLDSGRAIKIQIKAATTFAELDAIIDNR